MFAFAKRKLLCDRAALARWGEKQAQKFLKKQGRTVLARNYLCRAGELDLVMAEPDGAIVFVEVKTRSTQDFAPPQDSVTASKQQRLSRAAQYFLKTHDIENRPCRFDVVTVLVDDRGNPKIEHYPDAFA